MSATFKADYVASGKSQDFKFNWATLAFMQFLNIV